MPNKPNNLADGIENLRRSIPPLSLLLLLVFQPDGYLEQSKQLHDYLAAANYIESIGDMIETNLVDAGRIRLRLRLQISEETEQVLSALNLEVTRATERAIRAIVSNDTEIARKVAEAKAEINRLAAAAEVHLSGRLVADAPNRLAVFRLESEIMEYVKRMYYFAKRIAKLTSENNLGDAEQPLVAEAQKEKAGA